MRRRKLLFSLIIILALAQFLALGFLVYFNFPARISKAAIGVTFSPSQAEYFNLDAKEVLKNSLDDLGIKNYRLSAYWNRIEKQKDQYDFSDIDWQLDAVAKRDGKVILAIGRRLPRWPECHDPDWVKGISSKKADEKVLALLKKTVERYKNRTEITAWQVENEPFLAIFGKCPMANVDFYKKEVALVKNLDSRPIIATESGELSTWVEAARFADIVGISIYRTTWNPLLGVFYYPLTPAYYRYRAKSIEPFVKKVFVSELQAEPWAREGSPIPETPIIEQKVYMNKDRISASVNFAKRAGFDEIYLWGVEWWYWLEKQGDDSMLQAVKKIISENK